MVKQFLFSSYLLNNVPIPNKSFDVVRDSFDPRLCMYITSKGVKSFFIRKRINGKDTRIIIGRYPFVSIEDARNQINSILECYTKEITNKNITFKQILKLFFVDKVRRTQKGKEKLLKQINNHLKLLFNKKINSITEEDIKKCLNNIKGAYANRRMHELLISVFNYAKLKKCLNDNIAKNIPLIKIQTRQHSLNDRIFKRLVKYIKKYEDVTYSNALLMLFYTCLSKDSVCFMKWKDVNLNTNYYNNQPLTDKAVILLQSISQNNAYVFNNKNVFNNRKKWKEILQRAKIENLRISDCIKFIKKQVVYNSDKELYKQNMNLVLNKLFN